MAELVDAPDLGSGSERSGGSSPLPRTVVKSLGLHAGPGVTVQKSSPTSSGSSIDRVSREQRPIPWRIHFFKRHAADDPSESVPARDFLQNCPTKVEATFVAVVKAVAE